MKNWIYNDGGRSIAGFKGDAAGDCAIRAIAIATGSPYREVYDTINEFAKTERPGSKRKRGRRSSARKGVFVATMRRYMKSIGWSWKATMGVGTGCKVHLKSSELPEGNIICRVSRHYVAVKDGIIHDNHDPSRNGTRCVYGYWHKEK